MRLRLGELAIFISRPLGGGLQNGIRGIIGYDAIYFYTLKVTEKTVPSRVDINELSTHSDHPQILGHPNVLSNYRILEPTHYMTRSFQKYVVIEYSKNS